MRFSSLFGQLVLFSSMYFLNKYVFIMYSFAPIYSSSSNNCIFYNLCVFHSTCSIVEVASYYSLPANS